MVWLNRLIWGFSNTREGLKIYDRKKVYCNQSYFFHVFHSSVTHLYPCHISPHSFTDNYTHTKNVMLTLSIFPFTFPNSLIQVFHNIISVLQTRTNNCPWATSPIWLLSVCLFVCSFLQIHQFCEVQKLCNPIMLLPEWRSYPKTPFFSSAPHIITFCKHLRSNIQSMVSPTFAKSCPHQSPNDTIHLQTHFLV